MKHAAVVAALALIAPGAAYADCQADIATSYERANALAPSFGRSALLEQIQRAEIAHHEGDDEACREELATALDVLGQIDTHAAARPAAAPDHNG